MPAVGGARPETTNGADGNLDEMFYGTEEDSESEDTAIDLQRPGRASRERLRLQARRRAAVVGGGGGTEGHGPGQGGLEGFPRAAPAIEAASTTATPADEDDGKQESEAAAWSAAWKRESKPQHPSPGAPWLVPACCRPGRATRRLPQPPSPLMMRWRGRTRKR